MELIKSGSQEQRFLDTKTKPYQSGWLDAKAGVEPACDITREYDNIKQHYVLGYIHGNANAQRLENEA